MRTLSIRTLAALAYERGEEFDPGDVPTPALVEHLAAAAAAGPIVAASAADQRAARQRLQPRTGFDRLPGWFSACDLVDQKIASSDGTVVHGEVV
jgi:hypothetical protein